MNKILAKEQKALSKLCAVRRKHIEYSRKGKCMIYLDYNATTLIDKEVAYTMIPYLYGDFGNPSSSHVLGVTAKNAIEHARNQVAQLLNCESKGIVFTSGGSESNNTVLKGVAHTYKTKGSHIITSEIEHLAILNIYKYLESLGCKISYVPIDQYVSVNPFDIERLITDKTILVPIMDSNNETGTIQPIRKFPKYAKIIVFYFIPMHLS